MYQTIKTGLKSMSLNEADRRKIEESIEIIEFVSYTNCSRLWNLDARMYQDEFRTSTLSCCYHTVMRGCFSGGERAFLGYVAFQKRFPQSA
jgi:hypothetical protein